MIERIEINLLPGEYRIHTKRLYFEREVMYPILVLVMISVFIITASIYYKTEIVQLKKQITFTEKEIQKDKHILDEIKNLKQQKILIQKKIKSLEQIDVNREKWIRLQEVFCQNLPQFSWIRKIGEKDGNGLNIEIEGQTFSFSEVAVYMSKLIENKLINSVDLINIEQIAGVDKLYKFVIICNLNQDTALNDPDKKAQQDG